MEPAIMVRGLDHHFGAGEARRQVLFGLDLDIARGALVVLMGASGSGKTTLLTLLGGLRSVQAGSVRVLGREMAGASATALAGARRRMGFIFQAHNLHESLTAVQNVRLALDVHGAVPQAEAAAARALSLVGLEDRLHYHPARLSGGQKQRVAVARALAGSPEIIFADEPTAALDAENGLAVVALLKRLGAARGTTTLMVTHDNRVLDLADRIVTMRDGRLMPA
ncbi:ATP-binding cassette domain-containing protein [Roseococcus suduntuyensis]|uniref:Putative ABC transport system ATP-binding protein n=1 Tax=Roseococcus suduntuyensis TaxID=455361 RepID=A0A840A513_9PROT|nr:ATP-binding cassette domain-containing protein [Roseococcus suduntuyensis]MBB3897058.1 putative ABC transport system ATP-binding protein [Roseococcus suduntuyensis]